MNPSISEAMLTNVANSHPYTPARDMAQGVLRAHYSCRISGTLSMAIRRATPSQVSLLLDELSRETSTQQEVTYWLNEKGAEFFRNLM